MTMFPTDLHTEQLTVHVATPAAPDGDGVPTTTVRDVVLDECNVQGGTSSEVRDSSLEVATSYRVSAPDVGHGITPGSRVTWRLSPPADDPTAARWFVAGDALEFTGTGDLDHTEFTITRRKG